MEDMTDITIESYDCTVNEYWEKTKDKSPKDAMNRFLSHLDKGSTILDIGCGPGRDSGKFFSRGYVPTGMDLSQDMVDKATYLFPQTDFFRGDMRNISVLNNSFDGIWACASMIHVPRKDLRKVLDESNRVLVDDGTFYLDFKQGDGEELLEDPRYGGVKKGYVYYRRPEIELALEDSGFEVINFHGTEIGDDDYQTHTWIEFLAQKK